MNITEILKKLKFKEPGVILNAPEHHEKAFTKEGFEVSLSETEKNKNILLFLNNETEFQLHFNKTVKNAAYDTGFWLCYPKGTSKVKTDINRDILWKLVENFNMRPVSMISLDNTWSAMRIRPSELVKSK